MKRSAGILLPVSSLPSPYGIGCFDRAAYRFVDWLKKAGQSYWQILPLGPTSFGDSPYQSFSAFAGNPYFIDLEAFTEEGLLTKAECDRALPRTSDNRVDYAAQYRSRFPLLHKAYRNSGKPCGTDYEIFCGENGWLEDYALFMALKDKHGGKAWNVWDDSLRFRKADAMERCKTELAEEMDFYRFLQYHFYRQWKALKAYAGKNGIGIIGDIPIYTAYDSADTWAHPELFRLDADGIPTAVAGCPPDDFSADGQLWGNPLYRWEKHEETGFRWWTERLAHCFKVYDVVRIDHFRGFDEYYSIPYGEKTARKGHWEKGPGIRLFKAVEQSLGKRDVIAEDLGFMTDSVRRLVKDSGFPNMKVLEFAFDSRDSGGGGDHFPHNYGENCVAYTGTHDNQTLVSWFKTITEEERQMARMYLCDQCTPDEQLGEGLIGLIMRSAARLCVIPMQDWLRLDDRSRMNTPSTVGKNWQWRMQETDLTPQLCKRIGSLTKLFSR
ncbi:MAG: 4-alpha-glucanotransferase [Clostridia bacterium]|nr:4-alpha-glucanotransferase [Clostridia bacterium]